MKSWDTDKPKLRSLVKQGYNLTEHPEVFRSHFPDRTLQAIDRAIRRHCKDISVDRKPATVDMTGSEQRAVDRMELEFRIEQEKLERKYKNNERDLNRKIRTLLDQQISYETFLERVRELGARFDINMPNLKKSLVEKVGTRDTKSPNLSLILMLSDMHHGDGVDPEKIMGLNNVTPSISRGRIALAVDKTIQHQLKVGAKVLHIHLLGDIISGVIHDEIREHNHYNIVATCKDMAITLALAITELSPYFERVEVRGVSGNHGRFLKHKRYKADYVENYDMIVYQFISGLLMELDNVSLSFPPRVLDVVKIGKFSNLLVHGDVIRSYRGMPYYGIDRWSRKILSMLSILEHDRKDYPKVIEVARELEFGEDFPFRYIEMGHFHAASFMNSTGIETFVNGSIVGDGEYNTTALTVSNPPKQFLLQATPTEINAIYPLHLGEATEEHDRYKTNLVESLGKSYKKGLAKL